MTVDEVVKQELGVVGKKRQLVHPDDGVKDPQQNLLGIALSGGGIRSATTCLGFLEILNRYGILSRADYLSTVSGGGFTGSYVQARLHQSGDYSELFSDSDIAYMRGKGYYLAPGKRFERAGNRIRFAGAFTASLLMNLVWILLVCMSAALLVKLVGHFLFDNRAGELLTTVLVTGFVVLSIHYFTHYLRHIHLWSSDVLNVVEGGLLSLVLVLFAFQWTSAYQPVSLEALLTLLSVEWLTQGSGQPALTFIQLVLAAGLLGLSGLAANPNILTMHRFYRDRLAVAYLRVVGRSAVRLPLKDLPGSNDRPGRTPAPYPLVNTCLNLLGEGKHKGAKASEYFLLSPLYCGSKLTGYIPTTDSFYSKMTLATAVAVSGAAVNPGMGLRSNKIISFLMTVLNLQLGYWTMNPAKPSRFPLTWWPYYQILQLLSKTNANRRRVNISDGGHIENLGVYELIRRRCKLIIAVDAAADPSYKFSDLNNLVTRSLNELGVAVRFRRGFDPEGCIRPKPSTGFSTSHFAIADLLDLPKEGENKEKMKRWGLLVYVKSSMKAPTVWRVVDPSDANYNSYNYKTYHPEFPHESTADQFFDHDQWDSYFALGRFIAGDLLQIDLRDSAETETRSKQIHKMTINKLYQYFHQLGNKPPKEEARRAK